MNIGPYAKITFNVASMLCSWITYCMTYPRATWIKYYSSNRVAWIIFLTKGNQSIHTLHHLNVITFYVTSPDFNCNLLNVIIILFWHKRNIMKKNTYQWFFYLFINFILLFALWVSNTPWGYDELKYIEQVFLSKVVNVSLVMPIVLWMIMHLLVHFSNTQGQFSIMC